jgi:iodotyrosine deiodinase
MAEDSQRDWTNLMKPHDNAAWIALPEMSDTDRIARAQAFHDLMATRHSCRQFNTVAVPRNVIEAAILTARTAPSGANHQPWFFSVIDDPAVKTRLRDAAEAEERAFYNGKASDAWIDALHPLGTDADKPYLSGAPTLIVVFGQRRGGARQGEDRQNYYVTESVGIAVGLLLASLHSAGLATLTHTPNPMRFLNDLCDRPDSEKAILIVVVGHAAADATIPTHALIKKPLDQISNWI